MVEIIQISIMVDIIQISNDVEFVILLFNQI